MENFNNTQKLILGILAVILVTVVIIYVFKKDTSTLYSEYDDVYANGVIAEQEKEGNSGQGVGNKMFVHIAGEVENPGIFEVEENTRIADLIDLAGGLTKNGSIKNVNLAYRVEDGQKIYIPNIDEEIKQAQIEYVTESSGVLTERTKRNRQ